VFERLGDGVPRHPTQLYESFYYMICFFVLYNIYRETDKAQQKGFLLGLFMVMIFGFRFIIEFWKENQVPMEVGFTLNMGQMLSIPVVLVGLGLMLRSREFASEKPTNTLKKDAIQK